MLTNAEGVATFIWSIIDTDLPPSDGVMHQSVCSISAQVHRSTVMLFQATSTCMSSSNSKLLLLGPAY